jgi:hypothetical protein
MRSMRGSVAVGCIQLLTIKRGGGFEKLGRRNARPTREGGAPFAPATGRPARPPNPRRHGSRSRLEHGGTMRNDARTAHKRETRPPNGDMRLRVDTSDRGLTLITLNQGLTEQEFEGRERRVLLLGAPRLDRVDACTHAGAIGRQRGHWHVLDARQLRVHVGCG